MKSYVPLLGFFLLLITSLAVVPGLKLTRGQENDPYTLSVNSSPFGTPFKDWVVKWSTWELSFPKQENWNFRGSPGYIYKDCSYKQNSSSPVFFLPYVGAELGQVASMSCDVPRNKALLINIAGATSDYSDPTVKTKTPNGLIKLETQSNVYPVAFGITLDGHPIAFTNDQKYLVQTDLYNLTLPANNIWGEPAGGDTASTQGWWLMLKPLTPGTHVLHYTAGYRDSRSDPTIPEGQGNQSPYVQDVTYNILVR